MRVLAIFCFFISYSIFAKTCGLTGSIDERIKDCNQTNGEFSLVTSSESGVEIYKDLKSNLLWGSRIVSDFNHYSSQKACTDLIPEAQVLNSIDWRLPTIEEFKQAAEHGMKSSLPQMNYWFWSSSQVKIPRKMKRRGVMSQAYIWNGMEEKTDVGDLKDAASVRCVGKIH
ncbi:MAG: hypothetical protein AB7I27_08065 [Bacteriovoracaceae bacterium]